MILAAQRLCASLALAITLWIPLSPGSSWAGEMQSIELENLAGQRVNPYLPEDATAIVFVFVSVDCPVCNAYAPELQRLKAEFETNGIAIKLVYPNRDETREAIRQHSRDYELDLQQLRDPTHALVQCAGARVMPEAAVYVPKRGFIYCGRIDNRFAKLGVARTEITEYDLREVLESIVQRKPPKHKQARGIGCAIPDVR
jgi:thiol-disulfide isomerase/thioredoxin